MLAPRTLSNSTVQSHERHAVICMAQRVCAALRPYSAVFVGCLLSLRFDLSECCYHNLQEGERAGMIMPQCLDYFFTAHGIDSCMTLDCHMSAASLCAGLWERF